MAVVVLVVVGVVWEVAVMAGVVDFGDFSVSFIATVAGLHTRRGGPGLSVRGLPLLGPTRGPLHLPCNRAPQ